MNPTTTNATTTRSSTNSTNPTTVATAVSATAGAEAAATRTPTPAATHSPSDRSRLVADVATAGSIAAPFWPLTSFVAVNPLGGLTDLTYSDAAAVARGWFGARTHLSLAAYRAEHARGTVHDDDLDRAIVRHDPALARREPFDLGGRRVDPVEVVRWDLLHGPIDESPPLQTSAVAEALDEITSRWCAAFVDDAHSPWQMPDRERGFYRSWLAVAGGDRRLAAVIGRDARARLRALPDDPTELLHEVLGARSVADDGRVSALRTWILRTPGWAGFARWCDEWAPADRTGPRLRMIDLAAVRAAMDHLAPEQLDLTGPIVSPDDDRAAGLERRVDAAVAGFDGHDRRDAVAEVLGAVTDDDRAAIWLAAHELNFRDRLLARLTDTSSSTSAASSTAFASACAGGSSGRPDAQLVFCIDVRSEGFRRQLEALGSYDTYGFAGFFGVPVRWRPLGSPVAQARCPVLVSPRREIAEVAVDDDASYLAGCSAAAGLHDAFHAAKGGIASPFALAESAGWIAGPVAAVRTLAPPISRRNAAAPAGRRWWRPFGTPPHTAPVVDEMAADEVNVELSTGLSLEERTLFAEAIVTTIGMAEFAPLVVLCGHGSATTNNPHASSLDCGACGGAPGGASARMAAAILNDGDVRAGLAERGITIPTDTWFVAAEHDTVADVVMIFDRVGMPDATLSLVDALQRDLDLAGERNALERARRLPGRAARVRDRGRDWAEVRPEWGLAGNAAFVIGPRSITADHDLSGRCFLHSYDAGRDPDGVALETIMTAPLVVAQWISSQYYFSTVEPDLFGAGDKMLHNPVGGIGVIVGQSGDLAVGLPLQSVLLGEQRAHDPLRLLAVVQAPLERIEDIIVRNQRPAPARRGRVDPRRGTLRRQRCMVVPYTERRTWEPWHLADASMTEHRTSLSHTDLCDAILDLNGDPMTTWTDLPAMAKIEVVVDGRRRARRARPVPRRRGHRLHRRLGRVRIRAPWPSPGTVAVQRPRQPVDADHGRADRTCRGSHRRHPPAARRSPRRVVRQRDTRQST
jgi:uncharacterized protein